MLEKIKNHLSLAAKLLGMPIFAAA